MRSLKTYITILQKMGFRYSVYEIYRRLFWIGKNEHEIYAFEAKRCGEKLYKRYKSLIEAPLDPVPQENHLPHRDIWIFWGQGMDNAPVVVKKCYASVQKYCKEYSIHLLDNENLSEYVSLPEAILRLYDGGKGIMRAAHFSDFLRTELLVQHGGIWLDATILLTSELPEYITHQPMFLYRETFLHISDYLFDSYLISCEKGNPYMKRVKELLYAYWKDHSSAPISMADYLLLYNFYFLLDKYNKQAHDWVQRVPYVHSDLNVLIQFKFSRFPYDEHLLHYLLQMSPTHKLTYKYKDTPLEQRTIWSYLVNEYEV